MNDEQETEPYFVPFEDVFLRRRDEILRLVGLSIHAIRSLEGSARLGEALRYDEERLEEMRKIEDDARSEAQSGFPLLYGAATVLLWGSLETSVRDFAVCWLQHRPEAKRVPEIAKIRIQFGEYDALDEMGKIQYLVGILDRESGGPFKPGVGRFSALLKPFGIVPVCSAEQRKILSEMAAVRNVIVHRAGRADARFIEMCPWLNHSLGDVVTVDLSAFDAYVGAVSGYAASIIEAARDVAGAP